MEKIIAEISLIKKEINKKDLNKQEVQELVTLFGELLKNKHNMSELVELLLSFQSDMAKAFITEYYLELTKPENLSGLFHQLSTTQIIKPANYPNRVFPLIAILIENENRESELGDFICSVICRIEVNEANKKKLDNGSKGNFSLSCLKTFKANILNQKGNLNYRFLEIDYSNVNKGKLKSFTKFLTELMEQEMIDLSHDIALAWADKYEMKFPSPKETETEQPKDNIVAVENPIEKKQSKPPKGNKQSAEESSAKKSKEDKKIPLSKAEEVSVVAKPEKKKPEKLPSTETKTPQIKNTQEQEVIKKEDITPIFEPSTMVSELQAAEKSLLATINQAQASMGQMSTSLTDSLATIDFLKEENKSNEAKITHLKLEQSALEEEKFRLEEEKRELEEKIRRSSQKLGESRTNQEALTAKIALLEEELSQEKRAKETLMGSEREQQRQIEEQMMKITDLEQRLKKSLEQDAIAENQELITLKKELSRKLQEAYGDYQDMTEQEYSSDLLDSHKFLLERIFKMFKRHGITLEEEG